MDKEKQTRIYVMSYKEQRLIKTLLGAAYLSFSCKDDQRVIEFCKFAMTNCEFDDHDQYQFSDSLEFNFVRKSTDDEIIIFVSEEDERKFLEFLSTF